ncbi:MULTISPECIES: hypothetical protein [Flavobacterium]|uniref:hypothetical protein n=1 Tax=Flavobacterium TaxID=237 RepID=UPI001FCBE2F2|nr:MULTISPECIES: hypothetical protein [Flavobacterium]UOK42171.1 hypothetical protein LZF87_12735 [Flavobacterium enshiense]
MKEVFTFLLLGISFICNSQNLSLDELVSLRKKSLVTVEETLTQKGWNYIKGNSPDFGKLGSATFAYKKSTYDDKAQSFITYFYSDNSSEKKMSVQVNSKEKYTSYLARIKALGCKLIDSEMSEGSLIKTYQGLTTTFKIEITTTVDDFSSSTKTVYFFILIDNEYYNNKPSLFDDLVAVEATEAVDTVAAATSEETIYGGAETDNTDNRSLEEIADSYKIEKTFFIGYWSCSNFSIRFYENGTCMTTDSNKNDSWQEWFLRGNQLILNNNKIFYIKRRSSNSFEYSLSKFGETESAYRIGN